VIDNLFLCVGAQKAGTTWLHAQLKDHPDVGFSSVKEIHYFNTMHNGSILLAKRKVEHLENLLKNNKGALERYFSDISAGSNFDVGINKLLSPVNDAWYIDQFKFVKDRAKYCADFSPEYALLNMAGIENIKKLSTHQKIIFIMRDPVKRALSAVRYFYKMNGSDITKITSEEIRDLALSDLIINMSSYHKTFELYKEHFKSDFKYMFFENIMADKQGAINEVTSFLDIKPVIIDETQLELRVNATKSFEFEESLVSELKARLSDTYEYITNQCSDTPQGWSK
jgi:hypothetical protein